MMDMPEFHVEDIEMDLKEFICLDGGNKRTWKKRYLSCLQVRQHNMKGCCEIKEGSYYQGETKSGKKWTPAFVEYVDIKRNVMVVGCA